MFSDRSEFPEYAVREYNQAIEDGAIIAGHTNPWVEVNGQPIDWTAHVLVQSAEVTDFDACSDTCSGELVPGALLSMDENDGIQRCDMCDRFPGDLEAAQALADLVGGRVMFYVER